VQHQPKLLRCRTPRRGVPCPLRAAFAVFHDLDGLRLRSPCDLFQPLTPMGLGSRLPALCLFTSVRRQTLPDAGGRWCPLERLPVSAYVQQLAPRSARSAAAIASDRSGSGSSVRSPRPVSTACPKSARRRPTDHRLAALPRGLPRPATVALTAVRWLRPRSGVSSPVCLDPDRVLPLSGAGLPGTNRVVADPIRLALPARPALACPAVRVCRLSATTFPILLTACAGASSVRWPCCRLRGLVINL
jgi:hypothetical protein